MHYTNTVFLEARKCERIAAAPSSFRQRCRLGMCLVSKAILWPLPSKPPHLGLGLGIDSLILQA